MGAGLVLAQLRAQMALTDYASAPTLGLLYVTDHYAPYAREILDHLGAELPEVTDWAGTVGVGIAANNVEYFDEPAMAVMLCDLPTDQYRVFSGVAPLGLGFEAQTGLVHADPETPDLAELIAEMAARTDTGYLFGGLASSRSRTVQFAAGGNGNIRGQGLQRRALRRGLWRRRAPDLARDPGVSADRPRAHHHCRRRQCDPRDRPRARARSSAVRVGYLAGRATVGDAGTARHFGGIDGRWHARRRAHRQLRR
jgi:hypothetical protein